LDYWDIRGLTTVHDCVSLARAPHVLDHQFQETVTAFRSLAVPGLRECPMAPLQEKSLRWHTMSFTIPPFFFKPLLISSASGVGEVPFPPWDTRVTPQNLTLQSPVSNTSPLPRWLVDASLQLLGSVKEASDFGLSSLSTVSPEGSTQHLGAWM
jgi:hypothetical protein